MITWNDRPLPRWATVPVLVLASPALAVLLLAVLIVLLAAGITWLAGWVLTLAARLWPEDDQGGAD